MGKDQVAGKGYAGGEESCQWDGIMLVLQDDEECKNVVFAPEYNLLFQKNGPLCVRSQRKLQQTICRLTVYLFQSKFYGKTALCKSNLENIFR